MNLTSLIQTLETEVGIYKDFKELEESKTAVIIEGDIEKLDEILNTEHMLRMKLQDVEKKRIETMRSLGLAGKTLVDVIEIASGKDKEKLSEILNDLNDYIDALRQINDHNTKLVKSRLEIIASVTKLFKEPKAANPQTPGVKIAGSEKIYGKNAKVLDHPGEYGTSVINKKI